MTNQEELRAALVEARAWVDHAVSPIRPLSPVAAAPGDDLLRRIDAALAPAHPAGGAAGNAARIVELIQVATATAYNAGYAAERGNSAEDAAKAGYAEGEALNAVLNAFAAPPPPPVDLGERTPKVRSFSLPPERDALLRALLDYTSGFYGVAINHGMKAIYVADAIQHMERAARRLHELATPKTPDLGPGLERAARESRAIETEAKRIYDCWSVQEGWVPWVPRGNSDKQQEARHQAKAALAAERGRVE